MVYNFFPFFTARLCWDLTLVLGLVAKERKWKLSLRRASVALSRDLCSIQQYDGSAAYGGALPASTSPTLSHFPKGKVLGCAGGRWGHKCVSGAASRAALVEDLSLKKRQWPDHIGPYNSDPPPLMHPPAQETKPQPV